MFILMLTIMVTMMSVVMLMMQMMSMMMTMTGMMVLVIMMMIDPEACTIDIPVVFVECWMMTMMMNLMMVDPKNFLTEMGIVSDD